MSLYADYSDEDSDSHISDKDGDSVPPVPVRKIPEDNPSVADNESDQFTDLLPKKVSAKENIPPKLSVAEEIFAEIDSELPAVVDYGQEIPENLATRILTHFHEKWRHGDVKKTIQQRQKLPASLKDICTPKLQESVLAIKSINDHQKRSETVLKLLQL